ncbi:gamma-glutamyltransferase [Mesorhizobium sp. 1M-11]|uniref:gamma-glutamyltransferase family protein n=1 Tax=Mesorhizobium sp. 1M-11 TaxID=1529006 RepID=UPI0006C740F6|nr:gamma-glutamyltransferase [Mesorhizobium sp. 1M-11]
MSVSKQSITKQSASGRKGSVSAARQQSADAGIAMLELGGNAVDAAVAAGLVAGVIEPMETTLAGSGFMLVHSPEERKTFSVEFAPRAPGAASPGMYRIDTSRSTDRGLGISTVVDDENLEGIKAAGVPATLSGLIKGHERFGKLPLRTVVEPAIAVARDGFPADSYFALEVLANLAALRRNPGASEVFLSDGDPIPVAHLGETSLGTPPMVKQARLAETLAMIAEDGITALTHGAIGDNLVETAQELGGLLSRDDLREETTRIVEARRLRFRDHDVWGPSAPCGTLTQFQMLKLWERLFPTGGPQSDTDERLQRLADVSWHAFADRYHWLADPDFVPVPEHGLLSDAYIDEIATLIETEAPAPRSLPGDPSPWEMFAGIAAHDPWAHDSSRRRRQEWIAAGSTEPTSGTTHVSVIDAQGMAVSLTHTAANHFGSKVVCRRTGLLFDGAMGWFNARPNAANSIAGLKRPLANMAPMILTKDSEARAALGAPGGRRIISAVVQLAINIIERRMNAEGSVLAARIDASGPAILVSERLAHNVRHWDQKRYPTRLVEEQFAPFGYELARPAIVLRSPEGVISGATDPFTKGYSSAI